MPSAPRLLADALASALSVGAARHLREARIARIADCSLSPSALADGLRRCGVPASPALLDLEARAGGAALPGRRMLGPAAFLLAHPSLRASELPRVGEAPLFPVLGDPEHLADWESAFAMMAPTGAIYLYDAPHGPVPAFSSFEQLLELEGLAPMAPTLHEVRVDALCGELVAELLGATAHAPTTGEYAAGYVGADVWVKEVRTALRGPSGWCAWQGTFLLSERLDPLIDVVRLLQEEGYGLGHRGPTAESPREGEPVVRFVDRHADLGYRAEVEVTMWRGASGYSATHLVRPGGAPAPGPGAGPTER